MPLLQYANAGMGVWTIVNEEELQAFMRTPQHYHSFIVQARAAALLTLKKVDSVMGFTQISC